MYQYTMSTVSQGKYPRAKGEIFLPLPDGSKPFLVMFLELVSPDLHSLCLSGSVVAPRSDHSSSAPPMIQAAASAAGPPLVASPYPPSYLQYSPQQYSQQVIQAMAHYPRTGTALSESRTSDFCACALVPPALTRSFPSPSPCTQCYREAPGCSALEADTLSRWAPLGVLSSPGRERGPLAHNKDSTVSLVLWKSIANSLPVHTGLWSEGGGGSDVWVMGFTLLEVRDTVWKKTLDILPPVERLCCSDVEWSSVAVLMDHWAHPSFFSTAPQSFSHHSGSMHPPQPSSTPTGNQPPPQHAAPSPNQVRLITPISQQGTALGCWVTAYTWLAGRLLRELTRIPVRGILTNITLPANWILPGVVRHSRYVLFYCSQQCLNWFGTHRWCYAFA